MAAVRYAFSGLAICTFFFILPNNVYHLQKYWNSLQSTHSSKKDSTQNLRHGIFKDTAQNFKHGFFKGGAQNSKHEDSKQGEYSGKDSGHFPPGGNVVLDTGGRVRRSFHKWRSKRSTSGTLVTLSQGQKDAILDAFNDFRSRVEPPAADMRKLVGILTLIKVILYFTTKHLHEQYRGGSRGGSWGSGPPPPLPPPFWGTPKLHKEGKNGARMRAKTPHFST